MKALLGKLAIVGLFSLASQAATISVNPSNVGNVVVPANAGATFNFAPGTYTFTTNPTGTAADWSGVPGTFIGNGAVFALSGGVSPNSNEEVVKFAPGSSVSGFVFTDAQIHCEGGTFTITGNTFQNTYRGMFVANNSGTYSNNTIINPIQEGIYGYPGANGTYSNNIITGAGNDGIHFAAASGNNTTISGNVITGCYRIPIEVQLSGSNITVANNYAALIQPATGSYMALSIACGNANGVTVSGNTGVSNKANLGACVEIMGYSATIANNLSWGFGQFILNGAQGATLPTSNNVIYGGVFAANDSVPWQIAAIASSGDTNPPLDIAAMPTAPAAPTTTGTTTTGSTSSGSTSSGSTTGGTTSGSTSGGTTTGTGSQSSGTTTGTGSASGGKTAGSGSTNTGTGTTDGSTSGTSNSGSGTTWSYGGHHHHGGSQGQTSYQGQYQFHD